MKSRKTRMLVALGLAAISVFSVVDISIAENIKNIIPNPANAIQTIPVIHFRSDVADSGNYVKLTNFNDLVRIDTKEYNFVLRKGGSDASGRGATILGGNNNHVNNGNYSTIIAGSNNDVEGSSYGVIGGGNDNLVSDNYGTVAGGESNTAGNYSAVVGGKGNIAAGEYSVALGSGNRAYGANSMAMGYEATVSGNNSFLWSDSSATLGRSNTFAVVGGSGMVVNTNAAHRFAKLTIGGSLLVNEGTGTVACEEGVLRVINRTDLTGSVCFCTCDGRNWSSLFGAGKCSRICGATRGPGCGRVSKICDETAGKFVYSGTCAPGDVVEGPGAYMIDKNNNVHWTCETNDGSTQECIQPIINVITGSCEEPAGEYKCVGTIVNGLSGNNCNGEGLTDNTNVQLYASQEEANNNKCGWYCKPGFKTDGNFCVPYQGCGPKTVSGYSVPYFDHEATTGVTKDVEGGTCTRDFKCDDGHITALGEDSCQYSCQGTLPYHARLWYPSATLTGPTSYSYSANSTPAACKFRCDDNYTYNSSNNTCEASTQSNNCGTAPTNSTWVKSTFTQTWNGSAWTPASKPNNTCVTTNTSTVDCSFKCNTNYECDGNTGCKPKTQDGSCGTNPPANSTWVVPTFKQTWNGSAWDPASKPRNTCVTSRPSSVECSFICNTDYECNLEKDACVRTYEEVGYCYNTTEYACTAGTYTRKYDDETTYRWDCRDETGCKKCIYEGPDNNGNCCADGQSLSNGVCVGVSVNEPITISISCDVEVDEQHPSTYNCGGPAWNSVTYRASRGVPVGLKITENLQYYGGSTEPCNYQNIVPKTYELDITEGNTTVKDMFNNNHEPTAWNDSFGYQAYYDFNDYSIGIPSLGISDIGRSKEININGQKYIIEKKACTERTIGGNNVECGSADGTNRSNMPTNSEACDGGSVNGSITPTDDGWYWTCKDGIYTSRVCQAWKDPQCGSANGKTLTEMPSGTDACNPGLIVRPDPNGSQYLWWCGNGTLETNCSANKATAKFNLSCGIGNNEIYFTINANPTTNNSTFTDDGGVSLTIYSEYKCKNSNEVKKVEFTKLYDGATWDPLNGAGAGDCGSNNYTVLYTEIRSISPSTHKGYNLSLGNTVSCGTSISDFECLGDTPGYHTNPSYEAPASNIRWSYVSDPNAALSACEWTCVDGYKRYELTSNCYKCNGTLPDRAVVRNPSAVPSNDTTYYGYSANSTSAACKFRCETNYEWKSSTSKCEPSTRKVSCENLPTNAQWVNGEFTQTWDGDARGWTPATKNPTHTSNSSVECSYQCKTHYTWDGDSCEPDTQDGSCGTNPPANSTWVKSTFKQTWNGTAWDPASKPRNTCVTSRPSSVECSFICNTDYECNPTKDACVRTYEEVGYCYNTTEYACTAGTYTRKYDDDSAYRWDCKDETGCKKCKYEGPDNSDNCCANGEYLNNGVCEKVTTINICPKPEYMGCSAASVPNCYRGSSLNQLSFEADEQLPQGVSITATFTYYEQDPHYDVMQENQCNYNVSSLSTTYTIRAGQTASQVVGGGHSDALGTNNKACSSSYGYEKYFDRSYGYNFDETGGKSYSFTLNGKQYKLVLSTMACADTPQNVCTYNGDTYNVGDTITTYNTETAAACMAIVSKCLSSGSWDNTPGNYTSCQPERKCAPIPEMDVACYEAYGSHGICTNEPAVYTRSLCEGYGVETLEEHCYRTSNGYGTTYDRCMEQYWSREYFAYGGGEPCCEWD